MKFPDCRLHNVNLVDRFPPRCPMAQPIPLDAISLLQARGFRPGGGADLERSRVCLGCVARLSNSMLVRDLRAELGFSNG